MLASILRKRQPEINVSQAMDKMSISSHNLDIMFDIEDEFKKILCGNAMIDSFGEQAKTDHWKGESLADDVHVVNWWHIYDL